MVYQNGPLFLPLISPEAARFKCLLEHRKLNGQSLLVGRARGMYYVISALLLIHPAHLPSRLALDLCVYAHVNQEIEGC
jgi:hypothetical protein